MNDFNLAREGGPLAYQEGRACFG